MFIQLLSYFAILFTFTILIYWPFINDYKRIPFVERTKPYVIGLKFGLSGLLLTVMALELINGLIINSRLISMIFSGLLGGPVALLISGLVMGLGRLFLPGLTPITCMLNINFIVLTIVLFFFMRKYNITQQSVFVYFWLALTESVVILFVGLTMNGISFIYLLIYVAFTVFSFYFIYFVIHKVKHSNDTLKQMKHLQYLDLLTKLPNNTAVKIHINSLMRKEVPFTLLLIDINEFRLVNSLYDYQVGDLVIRQLGGLLQEYAQKNDAFVGRSGGEEFIVVLKELAPATAIVEANHFIQAIAKQSFVGPKNTEIRISVSVGLCSYPNNGDDLHTLTKNLIVAQQHAKANSISSYFHASNLK